METNPDTHFADLRAARIAAAARPHRCPHGVEDLYECPECEREELALEAAIEEMDEAMLRFRIPAIDGYGEAP